MPQKPNVVAGLPGPLVPLEEGDLGGYLRLDTWTLTEALFILNGNHPPGIESSSELMSHFWNAYHLAVNSIQSGNLCREIKVAGERRFIESPTRWLSWAERKNLYVAEAVRAEMMLAESVDEKTDAPAQGAPGLVAKSSLNEDRPGPAPVSKAGTTVPTDDVAAHDDQLQQAAELPDKRPRNRNVGTEALFRNRIEGVLAKAKVRWPDPQKRHGVNQMARLLVAGQPESKVEGFGEEAIRKILAGTYKPAKDRSIPGLSSR